jgi:hypothetical protein
MEKKSWLMIRGTQFRIWATQRLREYLVKGFALDDQRLKQAGGGNYFDELLARNRDTFGDREICSKMRLTPYQTPFRSSGWETPSRL